MRVQQFYKELFSSMALISEERFYFGTKGVEAKKTKKLTFEGAIVDLGDGDKDCSTEEEDDKIMAKNNSEVLTAPTQIYMVQHYSKEFNTFI